MKFQIPISKIQVKCPAAELRGIQFSKNFLPLDACLREAASAKAGGD